MSDTEGRDPEVDATLHDERSPLLSNVERPAPDKRKRKSCSAIIIRSIISLFVLFFICALVSLLTLPKRAQSYLEQTLQVDIASVEVVDINDQGASLQVAGHIFLNESRARHRVLDRRIALTLLSIAGPIELKNSSAEIVLGSADFPTIASADLDQLIIALNKNKRSPFDLGVAVRIKDVEAIGQFAARILHNEIDTVSFLVTVQTTIRRWISVEKKITQELNYKLPEKLGALPDYNITAFAIQDSREVGVVGQASLEAELQLPISARIPSVQVQVSIEGCDGDIIPIALAKNLPFEIRRGDARIAVSAVGECREIPPEALKKCSAASPQSPVDSAMQNFLAGNATTVQISGVNSTEQDSWLQRLLAQITIPVDIPGSQSDQLARDIQLTDVKFNLPSLIGGSGKPKISGKVRGTIDIPSDVDVGLKVDSVHVLADLLYKKKKFATIESPGWSPASSKLLSDAKELKVEVVLRDAPVTITNQDVFSSVISQLLGGNTLVDVIGTGDVKVATALGDLEAHELPIEAEDIEIGGFGFLKDVRPKIKELGVSHTEHDSMELVAIADVANPTSYEAYINYFDALMVFENRTLGNITIHDVKIGPGTNAIRAHLRYAPLGHTNELKGAEMLGRYLSEEKVFVTLEAHKDSLPDFPNLSHALAHLPLQLSIPVPRLIPTTDDDDDGGDHDGDSRPDGSTGSQFLVSAKFHLFSSTASFVLRNPLNETITVTGLHAVADYHGDVIGTLDYGFPITLPGTEKESETTRLPVSWRLPASDILRRALGGTLKVNATANATVSVGLMKGIPVSLSLHEVGAGVGI